MSIITVNDLIAKIRCSRMEQAIIECAHDNNLDFDTPILAASSTDDENTYRNATEDDIAHTRDFTHCYFYEYISTRDDADERWVDDCQRSTSDLCIEAILVKTESSSPAKEDHWPHPVIYVFP